MKLKAPDGIKNVAIDDQEFQVDKDGIVEVPDQYVEKVLVFGFTSVIVEDKKIDEKKKLSKNKDE